MWGTGSRFDLLCLAPVGFGVGADQLNIAQSSLFSLQHRGEVVERSAQCAGDQQAGLSRCELAGLAN